jgi:hypothetical protein
MWLRSDVRLRCRVLPGVLEAFEHGGAHCGGGVGVGGAHAGWVVAEPLVLEDLGDAEFGEQGLVAVAQVVEAQPRAQRRGGGGEFAPVACEALGRTTAVGVNTNLGEMAGSSPSITMLSNEDPEIAFQASTTGDLWTYNTTTGVGVSSGLGEASGTSPSIAATPGADAEIAFQASSTGKVWKYDLTTGVGVNTNLGAATGTSPAITTW